MRLSLGWTTNIAMLLIPTTANAHAAQNPVCPCVSANEAALTGNRKTAIQTCTHRGTLRKGCHIRSILYGVGAPLWLGRHSVGRKRCVQQWVKRVVAVVAQGFDGQRQDDVQQLVLRVARTIKGPCLCIIKASTLEH